jgi:hypothetical protein
MKDFLLFNTLITPKLLIMFYYTIAVLIPIFMWFMRKYLLKKFSAYNQLSTNVKGIFNTLSLRNRVIIIVLFLMMFLCMELCLRVMFEFIIAYFDMHDYLYDISNNLKQ